MLTDKPIPWAAEAQLYRTIGDTLGRMRLDEAVLQFMALSPSEQLAIAYLECAEDIPLGELPSRQTLSPGQIVALAEQLPAHRPHAFRLP